MGRINLCSSYALLFVVLSTGLFFGLSSKAFAYTVTTMPTIHTDTKLVMGGGTQYGSSSPCPAKEVTGGVGAITSSDVVDMSKDFSFGYKNASGYDGTQDAFITAYKNAITYGSGFGSLHGDYNGAYGDPQTVTLFYFDPSTLFAFSDDGTYMTADHPIHMLTLGLNYNAGCRYQFLPGDSGTSSDGSSNLYLPQVSFYLLATDNVTYPSGYTGDTIYSGHAPPTPVSPQFTYQVSDKSVSASDHALSLPTFTPDPGYTVVRYQVEWNLFKCNPYDTANGQNAGSCQGTTLTDHQIIDQTGTYKFAVADYGDYQLQAGYLVEECYSYNDGGATPDYCFYVSLGTELPDYDFTTTSQHFLLNGGSVSGDTAGETCDISGFCQVSKQDCTLLTDAFAIAQCDFNNAVRVGVLNPSLDSVKSLFSSMFVPSAPDCSLPLPPFTFATGQVWDLSGLGTSVCSSTARFRSAFPLEQVLVNFAMAMALLVMIVRLVNKVLDNNDNDIINGVG